MSAPDREQTRTLWSLQAAVLDFADRYHAEQTWLSERLHHNIAAAYAPVEARR